MDLLRSHDEIFELQKRHPARQPAARSLLMDEATLLAHRPHWSREPVPVREHLPLLTPQEQAAYQALRRNEHGASCAWSRNGSGSPPSSAPLPWLETAANANGGRSKA